MNKYMPNELENLEMSKKRIMGNVLTKIEQPIKRPIGNWKAGVMTAVFSGAILFSIFLLFPEINQQEATDPKPNTTEPTMMGGSDIPHVSETDEPVMSLKDFPKVPETDKQITTENSKPIDSNIEAPLVEEPQTEVEWLFGNGSSTMPYIQEKNGKYYVNGITLGDSKEQVIKKLGNNYEIIDDYCCSDYGVDFVMGYGEFEISFYMEKVSEIFSSNIDEVYIKDAVSSYKGLKYTYLRKEVNERKASFLYNEKTNQVLVFKADGNDPYVLYYNSHYENLISGINDGVIIKDNK